jgi:formamidopyrimidine-DNA glycosylase
MIELPESVTLGHQMFGNKGGYKTVLSKNTYKQPCPKCGSEIIKENYMGGSIYYCPACQVF